MPQPLWEKIFLKLHAPRHMRHRHKLAREFLRGAGLEIGALEFPLRVPACAHVTYVDRAGEAELRRQYPELADQKLARVDVIDDGEQLARFADGSQDFVIANHFFEHAQDPIATLRAHLRVLKPGGVLFLTVPDGTHTLDRNRPLTSWAHVLKDFREGPAWSYESHVREWAQLVEGVAGAALEARIAAIRAANYSIHYHVWNGATFREFLDLALREAALPGAVVHYDALNFEMQAIIQRTEVLSAEC